MTDEGDDLPEVQGKFTVREIRFVVGKDFSEVHVFVSTKGCTDNNIPGWHCKRFPTSKPFIEIYNEMCRNDSPLMWHRMETWPEELTETDLERIKI